MKIEVLERRVYIVPEIIESEVRSAIELKDEEYLEELISTVEDRGVLDEITTISCTEVKE